jgi:hypothetical protein
MLKKAVLITLAAVALLLLYAATRPDSFLIQRNTTVAVAPDKLYPLINDLRGFNTWNPFARMDPSVKIKYQGPASGPGAAYTWVGEKSGAGRMEIVESTPNERVRLKLDFTKPFEAHNTVDFTLQSQGDATQVTWAMHGPSPFVSRLMTIFFDMNKTVGADFEAGLQNLKALAEKMHPAAAKSP